MTFKLLFFEKKVTRSLSSTSIYFLQIYFHIFLWWSCFDWSHSLKVSEKPLFHWRGSVDQALLFLLKAEINIEACLSVCLDQPFLLLMNKELRSGGRRWGLSLGQKRKAGEKKNKKPHSFSLKSLEDQLCPPLCVLWMEGFELIGDRGGLA